MGKITQKWVNILKPYTSDYLASFSATELTRFTNIPQQTISRITNKLVNNNFLNYKIIGRNKLFSLDFENKITKLILNQIEIDKSLEFYQQNKNIKVIIDEFLELAETIVVFGSYASNKTTKNSDLDILFLGKVDNDKIQKIKRNSLITINEHYSSYTEFFNLLKEKQALSLEIIKNHVVFGDISKTVNLFYRYYDEKR